MAFWPLNLTFLENQPVVRAENSKDIIHTKRENAVEKDGITAYGQTSHQIMDKSNRNHDAPLKPTPVPMTQLNTNTPIVMNARTTQSSNVKPESTNNSVDKLIRAIVNPQAPLPESFVSEEMVKNIAPSTTQYRVVLKFYCKMTWNGKKMTFFSLKCPGITPNST